MTSREEVRLTNAKEAVQAYLEEQAMAGNDPRVRDFTFEQIDAALSDYTSGEVEEALSQLEAEDWIGKHNIHVQVIVPEGDEGQAVLRSFAEQGLVSLSPYVAVFLAGVLLYAALYVYGTYSVASGGSSEDWMSGLLLASVALPMLGGLLESAMGEVRRRRILSDEFYLAVEHHAKLILGTVATMLVLYWWGASSFPYRFTQGGVLAVIGIALTLGILGARLARMRDSPSRPEDEG